MAGIKDYSTTASDNTSLFPENMAAAQVNNSARQVQADIREWYEDAQWINLGDTPTYVSATQFTINANVTSTYTVNRRIKASGTTPFTVYGVITASSFSSPNTTITVSWDSGSLDNTLNSVSIGILTPTNSAAQVTINQLQDGDYLELGSVSGTDTITADAAPAITAYAQGQLFNFVVGTTNTGAATIDINSVGAKDIKKSIGGALVALVANDLIANTAALIYYDGTQFILLNPQTYSHGADIASSGTVNLDTATGNVVDVTGTTTITAITLAEGRRCLVRFTGALTLTHGASLVLPTSANITTAAGDYAEFVGYASGVVRCARYLRNDGRALSFSTASEAEMEAASSTTVAVTPQRQNRHPGHPKAWCRITETGGTYTLQSPDYNVASVAKNGTGDVTVTLDVTMSSTTFAVVATVDGANFYCNAAPLSTTTINVLIRDANANAADQGFSLVVLGDL